MTRIKGSLFNRVSAAALLALAGIAGTAAAQVDESNAYQLRLMTQVFDGSQEFSQTQNSAISRVRKGGESYTQIDFGDGSVAVDRGSVMAVGSFTNTSTAEAEFLYNYDTQTLSGANAVSSYFNRHVRKYLNQGPVPGQDGTWTAEVSFADLAVDAARGNSVSITLSRDYFEHEGKAYVLLTYDTEPFAYISEAGHNVFHWGKGFVLTDPGFGDIYWSSSLQRAVSDESRGEMRPYRYAKSMVMTNDAARPMVDPMSIPQTAALMDAYYGEAAIEPIAAVENGEILDRTPLAVSAQLDAMAMSLAENSINQTGQVTSQSNSNQTGATSPAQSALDTITTILGYGSKAGTLPNAQTPAPTTVTAPNASALLKAESSALEAKRVALTQNADAALATIERTEQVLAKETALLQEMDLLEQGHRSYFSEINQLSSEMDTKPTAAGLEKLRQLKEETRLISVQIAGLEKEFLSVKDISKTTEEYTNAKRALQQSADGLDALAAEAVVFQSKVDLSTPAVRSSLGATFVDKLPGALRTAIKSEAAQIVLKGGGAVLDLGGYASNAYTIGKSTGSVSNASNKDMSTGNVSTVRDYGAKGILIDLPLDILFMFINPDRTAASVDAAALLSSSAADIFVSGKALKDWNVAEYERAKAARMEAQAETKRVIAESDAREADYLKRIKEVEPTYEPIPEAAINALAKANLIAQTEERRKLREQQKAQADAAAAEQARIDKANADAAAERKRQADINAGAKARFEKDTAYDYPQVDPAKTKAPAKQPTDTSPPWPDLTAGVNEATDIATDGDLMTLGYVWDLSPVDLATYQAGKLKKAKEDELAWRASLRKDAKGELIGAGVRTYEEHGVTHYVTTSVDWNQPEFEMPVWVPPEFKSPKASTIDWTNFDGDDWPDTTKNFAGDDEKDKWKGPTFNLAFGYENMSGTVATDTSKWDEWIDSIGRRELEQLARQAGYPTLAAALNDWKNLVRQADDDGFRKWAMTQPGCLGSNGCGPNLQGRWTQKLSQLRLGDLIGESEAFASSAGLSDISIRSLVLRFSVFDNALEDGDIVQVTVVQFGRTLFNQTITLTNAAQSFMVGLNPGVAAVNLTAVNEGEFPPNTAALVIQDVSDGEGEQSYAADQGQTASLIVGVGR